MQLLTLFLYVEFRWQTPYQTHFPSLSDVTWPFREKKQSRGQLSPMSTRLTRFNWKLHDMIWHKKETRPKWTPFSDDQLKTCRPGSNEKILPVYLAIESISAQNSWALSVVIYLWAGKLIHVLTLNIKIRELHAERPSKVTQREKEKNAKSR